jgi:DNA transformation protein
MAVSAAYREYVLEQMGRVVPVASRAMFGAVGIYSGGVFFALMDDNAVYLKVDDSNRAMFLDAGMGPFDPYGDGGVMMQYYELPADLLETPDQLRPWVESALAVAVARRSRKGRKK